MKKHRITSDCPVCKKGQLLPEFAGMIKREYTEIYRCNKCNHREIIVPDLMVSLTP
jgi:ribosomal protein L37AE/L43A